MICAMFSVIICVSFFSMSVSAETFKNLSDKRAAEFISEHSDKLEELIKVSLNEADFYSTDKYSGTIKVSYPFSVPIYYADSNKLTAPYKYEKFSAVLCNNRVVGLVEILGNTDSNLCFRKFYYVSENYSQDIEQGLSFYHNVQLEPLEESAGSVAYSSIAFINNDESCSHLAYYECTTLVDELTREEYLIENSKINSTPTKEALKKYNEINLNTPAVFSFEITPKETENIADNNEYYIINGEKYLTYSNGKFLMSEYKKDDDVSQKFFFKKTEKGNYEIVPVCKPTSKLFVGGSTSFSIKLSFYNNYVYSVQKENNGLFMTSAGNKIVFTSYSSQKYNRANQIWKITSD